MWLANLNPSLFEKDPQTGLNVDGWHSSASEDFCESRSLANQKTKGRGTIRRVFIGPLGCIGGQKLLTPKIDRIVKFPIMLIHKNSQLDSVRSFPWSGFPTSHKDLYRWL